MPGALILILLSACNTSPQLPGIFSCQSSNNGEMEKVEEFENNFDIQIPATWRTELYFVRNRSGIMTADTTRYYSDAYTMNIALVKGGLDLSPALRERLDSILRNNGYRILRDTFFSFHQKPSYLLWAENNNDTMPVHMLQHYIRINPEKYVVGKCEFFGDKNIDSKRCTALNILETIHINE